MAAGRKRAHSESVSLTNNVANATNNAGCNVPAVPMSAAAAANLLNSAAANALSGALGLNTNGATLSPGSSGTSGNTNNSTGLAGRGNSSLAQPNQLSNNVLDLLSGLPLLTLPAGLNGINLIQQLNQPVFVAISTNPLILVPLNSGALTSAATAANQVVNTNSTNSTNANAVAGTNSAAVNLLASLTAAAAATVNPSATGAPNALVSPKCTNTTSSLAPTSLAMPTSPRITSPHASDGNTDVPTTPPIDPASPNLNVVGSSNNGATGRDSTTDGNNNSNTVSNANSCLSTQLNGLLGQAVLDMQQQLTNNFSKQLSNAFTELGSNAATAAANPFAAALALAEQQPMDLSAKRRCLEALDDASAEDSPGLLASALAAAAAAAAAAQQQQQLQHQLLAQLKSQPAPPPRTYACTNCQIVFYKQENYLVHKNYYCSATKLANGGGGSESVDDTETKKSKTTCNTNANTAMSVSPVQSPVGSQSPNYTKQSSPPSSIVAVPTQSSLLTNGQVGPQIQSVPVSSGGAVLPSQPAYKHFCNSCGIRFTCLDNLQAHQTYYCVNIQNGTGSTQSVSQVNAVSGLTEVTCPKCKATYCSEDAFLAHICSASGANAPAPSSTTTATNAVTNTTAASLVVEHEPSVQIKPLKITNPTSLLNGSTGAATAAAVAAAAAAAAGQLNTPILPSSQTVHAPAVANHKSSSSNNQAFKCTICGYKGHTLRGMKTHVRIHGDQLQGVQEENFIAYLDECCANTTVASGGSCGAVGCRNGRTAASVAAGLAGGHLPTNAGKRRKSTDPAVTNLLANLILPGSQLSIGEKLLLASNQLNNQLVAGQLGPLFGTSQLTNHLTSQLTNHLVGGLMGLSGQLAAAAVTQNGGNVSPIAASTATVAPLSVGPVITTSSSSALTSSCTATASVASSGESVQANPAGSSSAALAAIIGDQAAENSSDENVSFLQTKMVFFFIHFRSDHKINFFF